MLAPPNCIQIKTKKHCEDQTKSAGGSHEAAGPPFCDLWKKKTRGQRTEAREGPTCESWVGAGRQEEQAGTCVLEAEFLRREGSTVSKAAKRKED